MRIAISAMGQNLEAQVSPVFGRCPYYILVNTETMEFEALPNPSLSAPGGAGIQAAQLIASKGVGAVLTGNTGPNAFSVLQAVGISVFTGATGTVRDTIERYKIGQLTPIAQPSVGPFTGMGGMGRGMGMGRGAYGFGAAGPWGAPPAGPPPMPGQGVEDLKAQAQALKEELGRLMKRIEELEKGE